MIEKIGHYALENPGTIYDEEAMTALKLAGRTAQKVNEVIDQSNKLVEDTTNTLNRFENEVIPLEVSEEVQEHIRNGDFDKAINTYLGDLNSRVNHLLTNIPSGATTMDAEVIDGRLGADGQPHNDLGTSIRTQFKTLGGRIGPADPYPVITFDNLLEGSYFSISNGGYGSDPAWKRSRYLVPCGEGVLFACQQEIKDSMQVTCYDKNFTYLGYFNVSNSANVGQLPKATYEGTAYIGFSCKVGNDADAYTLRALNAEDIDVIEYPFDGADKNYIFQRGCYITNQGQLALNESWGCLMIPAKGLNSFYTNHVIEAPGVWWMKTGGYAPFTKVDDHTDAEDVEGYVVLGNTEHFHFVCINVYMTLYHYGDTNHLQQYVVLHHDHMKKNPLYWKNILCVGDSITYLDGKYGHGDGSPLGGWQCALRKAGAFVDTRAWSGSIISEDSTGTIIKNHLINQVDIDNLNMGRYDVVIIFAGTNDVYTKQPLSRFQTSITNLIEWVYGQKPNAEVYMVNIMPSYGGERTIEEINTYNEALLETAESMGVRVVDMFHLLSVNKFNFSQFFYDTVHPNSKGFRRIGHIIRSILENTLGE